MIRRILLLLALFALAFTPVRAQIARDSIAAAVRYFTVRIDSIEDLSTNTMKPDTIFQADPKKFPSVPVVQLQIDVVSSLGRTDTIIVKKRVIVARSGATNEHDTLWVPVALMKLGTAVVDTIGVVGRGPYASQDGGSYRVEQFLVYDAFMDGQPWRIERRSGKGHPVFPDASATHVLYFTFQRRASYAGGR